MMNCSKSHKKTRKKLSCHHNGHIMVLKDLKNYDSKRVIHKPCGLFLDILSLVLDSHLFTLTYMYGLWLLLGTIHKLRRQDFTNF